MGYGLESNTVPKAVSELEYWNSPQRQILDSIQRSVDRGDTQRATTLNQTLGILAGKDNTSTQSQAEVTKAGIGIKPAMGALELDAQENPLGTKTLLDANKALTGQTGGEKKTNAWSLVSPGWLKIFGN